MIEKKKIYPCVATREINNYFCAHLTNADLSILDDFNEFKGDLSIVNKSFVTLGKPLSFIYSLLLNF